MAAPRVLPILLTAGLLTGLSLTACQRDSPPAQGQAATRAKTPAPDAPATPEADASEVAEAAGLVRKDGTIFAETELMGTRVSVNVWIGEQGDALGAKRAISAAIDEMARIEDIASEWRSTSDLSRVNDSAGEPVVVPDELIEILTRAAQVSADTDGLFDVSFYSVGQLWSFRAGAQPPTQAEIDKTLPGVDWRAIVVDPTAKTVRLDRPGMKIGLGAIAKGYAVDRAAAKLHTAGFANHIVEAGGDTQVSGNKGGKTWRVGVQDPKQDGGRIGHIIAKDESVVTSGNYARFFEWEGVHYTHILDPRTGWPIPADRSPKSVTLVAQNATDADAYCTAVSVMSPEQGLNFVESQAGLEVVIISPDDTVLVSSGLEGRFIDERL